MKISPTNLGLKKARIEMLPLIDIVFLVLVVFIYAMLSMAVHRGIPVSLPQSETGSIANDSSLTITISADGALALNRHSVDLSGLRTELMAQAVRQPQPAVIIFGDRQLHYQRLVDVLDSIRQAGLERVSMQADPAR